MESEIVEPKIHTVSEITREIKILLETNFEYVLVEGEISNLKRHSSGHFYFSLKDKEAQIPCVMWRSRNQQLRFTAEDGMKVIAHGRISLYEKRGAYQLDVFKMQPAGIGELQFALEQLKQKLHEEGLFEEEHKKPVPMFPARIGIVTSPTGAAIKDLVNVINRRSPGTELILNPVKVQGDDAAPEIARAIEEFNEYGQVDVLVVGRGGGSLEDLWAFNEEIVARAIFNSKIPVISAVGHEIDYSISDFVADLRAPTPSAAAELAVPDRQELQSKIRYMLQKMVTRIHSEISFNQEKIKNIVNSYAFRRPADMVRQYEQRLDELTRALETSQKHRLRLLRERTDSITQKLNAINPEAIFKRGYSICYNKEDGSIVRKAKQLAPHDKINVKFSSGDISGTVDEVNKGD
ncbi:exodeoxyribonuclease VII large subunit [candidate division KSB1 bacterium]|nr:exodeoxyribonuclease VII large subunit [candidate division KSB1 bacterium]